MFLTLNDFLTSVDVIVKELLDIISQHLQELPYDFEHIIFLNMRILEIITALVNKMIVIICCIHCDCLLCVKLVFFHHEI